MSCWQAADSSRDVLAHGLDERVHRLAGGLAPRRAELVGGEVGLVAVGLDRRGVDDPGAGALEGVEHLLAPRPALVQHDEGEVGLGLPRERGEQVGLQLVVGLVEVVHDDALRPAEQRRAGVQGELTGGVGGGVEPDRLELGLGDLQLVEGLRDSPARRAATRARRPGRTAVPGGAPRPRPTWASLCHGPADTPRPGEALPVDVRPRPVA